MATAEHSKQQRSRKATSSVLRLLAAALALLLTASSLGQAAHFLLVPHAICAEHGELLELGDGAAHAADPHEAESDSAGDARASAPEVTAEHDHCQVLARGQREQARPSAASVTLMPAALPAKEPVFVAAFALATSLTPLAVAPKTSPPSLGC